VVEPYKLQFMQYQAPYMDSVVFEITNVSEEPVNLRVVDYPEEYLTVEIDRHIEPGQNIRGTARIKEESRFVSFAKSITLEIENEDHTRLTIPVGQTVITSK
jgi:hypothetical protein